MTGVLPDPDSDFGRRVRTRLTDEHVIWLTTVGSNGTPQPNPVWFLWRPDDPEAVLVYNAVKAARLAHVAARPRVSLNFHGNGQGGDIIVLTGTAEQDDAVPAPKDDPAYLAKYADSIARLEQTPQSFSEQYRTPLRITITKVRGF
jgi:PPOX class probable F420-dependent enzyme